MLKIADVVSVIPRMKSGEELEMALKVLPRYDAGIVNTDKTNRLIALSDLYDIYIPSRMTTEIYNRLYLALIVSLRKKGLIAATLQQYENHKAVKGKPHNGIIGGSDSFTIIGMSGIGKSSAINRAIEVITEGKIIEVDEPYTKIIPCLTVQCPFDCSSKGLLMEILRKADEVLHGKYYERAIKTSATVDILIGSVSNIAINHIGILIVDEIQNVCNHRQGKSLIAMLTQLINNSGISICMVGVPETVPFFEQALHLARRSIGLEYTTLPYDAYFVDFCKTVYGYQYVKTRTEITDAVIEWLYEHSSGMVSVVISLIHDAQEMAIPEDYEMVDVGMLNKAYEKRLSMLHGFIEPSIVRGKQTSGKRPSKAGVDWRGDNAGCITDISAVSEKTGDFTFAELAKRAKKRNPDMAALLKQYISVEEVSL